MNKSILIIIILIFVLTLSLIATIHKTCRAKQLEFVQKNLILDLKEEQDKWEEILVLATAYTAGYESTGKHPGHPAYGITKSGTKVLEGRTIATDPKLIPLGSKVKIPCLSNYTYIAEDIGGKIKGKRIDIYMENLEDALNWGKRWVKIYVKTR